MGKVNRYENFSKLEEDSKLTFLFETGARVVYGGKRTRKYRIGFFLCECGTLKEMDIIAVKTGGAKSCGCLVATRGGLWDTPGYNSWWSMVRRCSTENGESNEYYNEKGISVCERWADSVSGFSNFLSDMGRRPDGMTLDRIDPDKDYSPENCRWANHTQQSYNQRIHKNNTSGCTGVSLHGKKHKVWGVTISKNGETYYYGGYPSYQDAVNVRILAEIEHYGHSVTLRDQGKTESDVSIDKLKESLNRKSDKNPLENLGGNSKLTEKQKREIEHRYHPYIDKKAPNGFLDAIANEYGVGHHVINRVVKNIKVKGD